MEFERETLEVAARGVKLAERLIMKHAVYHREPSKLPDGGAVVGYGRRLREFPIDKVAALFLLQDQLRTTRSELWIRVLETCAQAPLNPARVAVVYVLATVVGVQRVVDWQPFWAALKSSRYQVAAVELMQSNLDQIMGDTLDHKKLVAEMIAAMISGELTDTVH